MALVLRVLVLVYIESRATSTTDIKSLESQIKMQSELVEEMQFEIQLLPMIAKHEHVTRDLYETMELRECRNNF